MMHGYRFSFIMPDTQVFVNIASVMIQSYIIQKLKYHKLIYKRLKTFNTGSTFNIGFHCGRRIKWRSETVLAKEMASL